MIARHLQPRIEQALSESPAVALLGPRQVGKTTLALAIAEKLGGLYLDLESESDRAKLQEPELYLSQRTDRLVVLDEVHRVPGLFATLRGVIDAARRRGQRHGLYLLLGSASLDLLRQSGESLAGRISYHELSGVNLAEAGPGESTALWLRGGFPDSLLAPSNEASLRWRQDFIRTYLERDIPQFGPRIPSETLRRLWQMLGHQQGGLLNVAQLARNLGIDGRTAARYIDLLVDLLLVRRLSPWHANLGKRLVKSPKVYLRDSGLLHALLGINDSERLLGHPVVGASWEGHVIDNLLGAASRQVEPSFFRTAAGAEIDLLLTWPDGQQWAIEIKRSLRPQPERGFHHACADLEPARRWVIYPGSERYATSADVEAMPLLDALHDIAAHRP